MMSVIAAAAAAGNASRPLAAEARLRKAIPSTGELIPAIGLGSWITFNVGGDPVLRGVCRNVINAFAETGGGIIDSSPMYGSSQVVIGDSLAKLGRPENVFSADKIWTSDDGGSQLAATNRAWGVARFDLLQVHNLVNWQTHLETLFAMKAAGQLRYVGITTSHGRQHREVENVMRHHPIDFVQLTYNIVDRDAEKRLLPLAEERGIAIICNRPFRRGSLPDRMEGERLPAWAPEISVTNWPQFMLKFIISHPAVTVAIPATRKVEHALENKSAEFHPMPDKATRERMAAYVRIYDCQMVAIPVGGLPPILPHHLLEVVRA
jgi:diketogulonate reductase-like aldo/keto reductase